jgi:hypothetical protein
MLRFLAILCVSTSVLAADSHAQPPGETASYAPSPRAATSYRRQLMLADGLAAGTVGAAVAAGAWLYDPDDFHLPLMVGAFGFTSYVITAPIIHFAHGNVGRGLLSGSARVLFPAIVSATLTVGLGLEERDDGYGAAFGTGFAIGAVGAIAVDWFVLTPSAAAEHSTPLVAPTFSASAEHVFLGVGGSL